MADDLTGVHARFRTQAEFWEFYVRAHRSRTARWLHFIGTALALACLVLAVIKTNLYLVLAAPVIAYAFAWLGHFTVEANTPATFGNPLRSIAADGRMFWLMCRGRMDDEVRRVLGNGNSSGT